MNTKILTKNILGTSAFNKRSFDGGAIFEGLRSAVDEMNWVSKFDVPGRQMSLDEIRAMEPSSTGPMEGGRFFSERSPLRSLYAG